MKYIVTGPATVSKWWVREGSKGSMGLVGRFS